MEDKAKAQRRWDIVYRAMIIASLICFVLCCSISVGEKTFFPIICMPLVLTIVLLINKRNRLYFNNLSLIICNIALFCRYSFYPTMIMHSIDTTSVYANNLEVVVLMIYELIGVNTIIFLRAKRLSVQCLEASENKDSSIGIISLILIFGLIISIMLEPSLINRFSLSISTEKSNNAVSTINTVFQMGLWSLIVFLVTSIKSTKGRSRAYVFNFISAMIVCLYYLLFNIVSSSNIHRWKIIVGFLSLGYLLKESFPAYKKAIYWMSSIGVFVGVIFGTFAKFNTQFGIASFIYTYVGQYRLLDEYFSGIRNIKFGLDMINSNPESRTLLSTMTDFFSGMPIISRLFPEGTKNSVIIMYQQYVGRKDVICPIIVQSIAHFSRIGAPIMSMLMMTIGIEFNRLLKKTKSKYVAFVCIEATFYCSLFMGLNTMIILGVVWIRLAYIMLMNFNYPVVIRTDIKQKKI